MLNGLRVTWLLLVVLTFLMSIFPIQSGDLLLYLAIARRFFAEGKLPETDPFLYSLTNYWPVYPEWLTYFVWYGIYKLGGWTLVILAKAILFCSFPVMVAWLARRLNYRSLAPVVIAAVAVWASAYRFIERGSLFSDLLTCWITLTLLLERRAPGRLKYVLPVIFMVWVNLHPGYPVGLALCAAAVAVDIRKSRERAWRQLAGCVVASVLACLVNPRGLTGFLYPFVFRSGGLRVYKQYVYEFFSPFHPAYLASNDSFLFTALVALTGVVWVLAFLEADRGTGKPWFELLCAGLLAYLGSTAIRFVPTATFSLTLICTALLAELKIWPVTNRAAYASGGILALICLKIVLWGYTRPAGHRELGFGLDLRYFPVASVRYIESLPNTGNIFNEQDFGAYLAWVWDGKRKYFYDGFTQDANFLENEYLAMQYGPEEFERITQQYNIRILLLSRFIGLERFLPILSRKPEWKLVHQDPASLVFVKEGG
jgi:hypothetical protein